MNNNNIIEMLMRIDRKLDKQSDDIAEIKIAQAALPCGKNDIRLKLLEKVVFGAIAIILVGFLVTLSGNDSTTKKSTMKGNKKRPVARMNIDNIVQSKVKIDEVIRNK